MQRRAHNQRHIPHLVITREGDHFLRDVSVSSLLSDYFFINIKVFLRAPILADYRSYMPIVINGFLLDLKETQLLLNPTKGLDQLVELYDSRQR